MLKRCSKCKELKNISEFYRLSRGGTRSDCKMCKADLQRQWKKANPDALREQRRRYRKTKAAKEYQRKWRQENADKVAAEKRRYIENNRERKHEWDRNRRARKKGSAGRITKAEWMMVLDKYGHKCLYPGCERTDVTLDHVVPLARGGTHTVDNVQPLCNYHNRSKYATTADYRTDGMRKWIKQLVLL